MYLLPLEVLLPFFAAAIALALAPGPDNLFGFNSVAAAWTSSRLVHYAWPVQRSHTAYERGSPGPSRCVTQDPAGTKRYPNRRCTLPALLSSFGLASDRAGTTFGKRGQQSPRCALSARRLHECNQPQGRAIFSRFFTAFYRPNARRSVSANGSTRPRFYHSYTDSIWRNCSASWHRRFVACTHSARSAHDPSNSCLHLCWTGPATPFHYKIKSLEESVA